MTDFYVGQKVVCIDASDAEDFDGQTRISKGSVYTIRSIGSRSLLWRLARGRVSPGTWVRLQEIDRGSEFGNLEVGYRATRFRPLIETDISIFTAMLAPKPAREREIEDT